MKVASAAAMAVRLSLAGVRRNVPRGSRALKRLGGRIGLLALYASLAACATPQIPPPVPWAAITASPAEEARFRADTSALPGGLIPAEAKSFVEFAVELDNEDDRLKLNDHPRPEDLDALRNACGKLDADVPELRKCLYPHIATDLWDPVPVYDSRQAFIADYFHTQWDVDDAHCKDGTHAETDPCFWKKDFATVRASLGNWKSSKGEELDEQGAAKNPNMNGFGPWHNAWVLYRGVGTNEGKYAVVIRGTVFSDRPSAVEDALFEPVYTRAFLTPAFSFAQGDDAAVHGGFAHATFTLMLDARYGVLSVLEQRKLPPGSTIYIVGHSQGAAMATMVHAFMLQTMWRAESGHEDPFVLKGQKFRLKSYGFAQPKPGDWHFAAEFARFTQPADEAIVINNTLDPVPKVPLTLGSTEDLEADFRGHFLLARAVRAIAGVDSSLRHTLSTVLEEQVRESARNYAHYHHYKNLQCLGSEAPASTWNFTSAGHVFFLYGQPQQDQSLDPFFQHHATTYRRLMDEAWHDAQ
jgi:hypothetical protein